MIQNIDRAGLDTAVWTHSIISICTESESEGGCLDLDAGQSWISNFVFRQQLCCI